MSYLRWKTLQAGALELWWFSLDCTSVVETKLVDCLCEDEKARVERFMSDQHKRRFIVARGSLRVLLSCYLNCKAEDIVFEYGPYGKPTLPNTPIHFNLSHSDNLAVVAVTKATTQIGVDIECLNRRHKDGFDLARHFFHHEEYQSLLNLGADDRHRAFLQTWSRKESVVKALGLGINYAFNVFQITVPPELPRLLSIDLRYGPCSDWFFEEIDQIPGAVGTVAVKGEVNTINVRQYHPGDSVKAVFDRNNFSSVGRPSLSSLKVLTLLD